MNAKLILLMFLLASSAVICAPAQTRAEKELLRIWSGPSATAKERAAAVNRCFTNGTPVSKIVSVLGPNYIRVTPYSMISLDGSPIYCWLEYTNTRVSIQTSARLGSEPLDANFTSAGYPLEIHPIEIHPLTNNVSAGQPNGAANRSQPFRAETNRTPAADGSGR
jgi:hypothetical protein